MRHQRLVHAGARLLGDAHGDVALATDARRVRLVGRVAAGSDTLREPDRWLS